MNKIMLGLGTSQHLQIEVMNAACARGAEE